MTTLARLKAEWEQYIVLKDDLALDIIMATVVGNALIPRDPLWLMLIAPSSGGKSTLIAPCNGIQSMYFLDDLTEKTFLSGYKVKGKEISLLKVLGSGVLCFSDFTSILSKNPMSRNEILGQLRLVYDGTFTKRTGTGEIAWKGKMGFLGACTPDIYFMLEGARSMGERYLYYWLDQPTDEEIVKKQQEVNMSSRDIAAAMHPFYQEYVEGVRDFVNRNGLPTLTLTPEQERVISDAAKFCVNAKSTIHLDFKTGKPDSLVSKPGVGRDRKMFQTLLHALQLMNCYERGDDAPVTDAMIHLVKKCGWSSVSRERRKVMEILTKYNQPMTASEIGSVDGFGLPRESVEKYLHALHAVGLIQMSKKGNAHAWSVDDEGTRKFVREVAGIEEAVHTLPIIIQEEPIDEALNNF